MSAPFIDLSAVKTLLSGLVTAGTIADLRILGVADRAPGSTLVRACPSVAIAPASSSPDGPAGLGNGRILSEQFDLVITVEQLASNDETAWTSLRTIRAACFDLLEGKRLSAAWSPLRYQGGQPQQVVDPHYFWADRYQTQSALPIV